jgi:hypothetical protein
MNKLHKLMIATAAMLTIGTAAIADNTKVTTSVATNGMKFNISSDLDGGNSVGAGIYVLQHNVGKSHAEVFVSGAYGTGDEVSVGAEYVLTTYAIGTTIELGTEVMYVAPATDFSNGDVMVTPSVNVAYNVAPMLDVFGEVGYTFQANDGFSNQGGTVAIGVDFALTDTVTLTPSVARSFDTASNDTQAAFELGFKF